MEKQAQITSKGQVTVPLEIRRLLRLKQGDKVVFEAKEESVTFRRVRDGDVFTRFAGRYRVGEGKTREEINADLREFREG